MIVAVIVSFNRINDNFDQIYNDRVKIREQEAKRKKDLVSA